MSETPRRRGLGRGLDALLSSSAREATPEPGDETTLAVVDLAIHAVEPNPEQPRHDFDPLGLDQLAESIRVHGILQPIVVERDGRGGYRLVAGERRLRAARLAGLSSIPAVVRPAADSARHSLELALVENLQRADLTPLDEAAAFSRLADTFGLSHDAIALRVARSRPSVTNAIRLLQLPAQVQQLLASGAITAGHGRALLPLDDVVAVRLATRVVEEQLSVRTTERAVADALRQRQSVLTPPPPPSGATSAPPVAAGSAGDAPLTRGLEEALGTPVRLERRRRGGRLVIEFFDDDQLDGLYRRLGGRDL